MRVLSLVAMVSRRGWGGGRKEIGIRSKRIDGKSWIETVVSDELGAVSNGIKDRGCCWGLVTMGSAGVMAAGLSVECSFEHSSECVERTDSPSDHGVILAALECR